jgi:HAD superfamily hydrolase (TIGR01484 family)
METPLEESESGKGNIDIKINSLIKKLADFEIFPSLNNQKLIDILKSGKVNLVDFIRNYSILSHPQDIYEILNSKYLSVYDQKINEKTFLEIYEIIFGEESLFKDKTILFSGGTGSNNIVKSLIKFNCKPKILINAYDDGKSTGDIRRKFNLLGPSDIAKNISILLKESKKGLKDFMDYRFPILENPEKLKTMLKESVASTDEENPIVSLLYGVETSLRDKIKEFIKKFYYLLESWETKEKKIYDLRDYALRNILYVGAFFYYNKDYVYTNKKLSNLFLLLGEIILNSQENLWIVGITNKGNLLNAEESIINDHLGEEICEIFLVKNLLNEEQKKKFYSFKSIIEKIRYIKENFSIYPKADEEILEEINHSGLILFPPTTLHSSLFPTLITKGVSKAINQSNALKICVPNLVRERGHNTVVENILEIQRYLNWEIKENPFTEIDYIVINTHGNRTDGVINANRIPIDKKTFFQYGFEAIEVYLEDENKKKLHNADLTVRIIISLKKIDSLGFRIHRGRLMKKEEINFIENKKDQLRELLKNPLLYWKKDYKIRNNITEILGIKDISNFRPIRQTKVIILGAGKALRLNSDIPKILYPINGKANLAHLLEKYSIIDKNPIVIISKDQKESFRKWSKLNPKYGSRIIITEDTRGSAMTFRDVLKREFENFKGDILLSWGDITNIKKETILLSLALHQAMGNSIMTIPTAWEENPYAGLERDEKGLVKGVFLTKEYPEQKREFGEHDCSLFILRSEETKKALDNLVSIYELYQKEIRDLNFLEVVNLLASQEKEILGIACADPRECFGFNTRDEAKLVEKYMAELSKENFYERGTINLTSFDSTKDNSLKFEQYASQIYKGLIIDFDETLTNSLGDIPVDLLENLVRLVNKGIPLGIITGRTNNSLKPKLINKIIFHPSLEKSSKSRIYIYPEGGAYCYRIDSGKKMYEFQLSEHITETATVLLRENILEFMDDYSITKYKIHIWPKSSDSQKQYVKKINLLFKKMNIPLLAYRSSSIGTSGSILISKKGVNKELALSHFSRSNGLGINEIAKIGDMGDVDSVDYPFLKGIGSFSVSEIDPENPWQASILLSKGFDYKGVNGTRWLLNNLKFKKF